MNPRKDDYMRGYGEGFKDARAHFGDPCIHCGIALDDLTGSCVGEGKAIPIAYASLGVRWDGVEHFRIRFSDNHIEEQHRHISEHAPYYHFGHSDALTNPPRYDARLKS